MCQCHICNLLLQSQYNRLIHSQVLQSEEEGQEANEIGQSAVNRVFVCTALHVYLQIAQASYWA